MTLPLHGCRVLDLGIITAGAATGAMLADLGAEVIKVESPTYRDPFRNWNAASAATDDGFRPFRFTNRNKEGISIDLKTPAGRDVFLELARRSDIVVENFRRGVLEELGIGYDSLTAVRPGIILASISSQGESGPKARYVSFGSTLEAMGGQAWHTGYDGASGPVTTGRALNYPDQVVALFATGMVLAAYRQKRRTGQGAHLDLSQRELTSFLVGEEFAAAESRPARAGNADDGYFFQRCLRTQDGWMAVSIPGGQTPRVAALIGEDDFTEDGLARWCAGETAGTAAASLQAIGVAAAPVLHGAEVREGQGLLWSEALASMGSMTPVKGFPFSYDQTPLTIYRDAPGIGEHTARVLTRVVGYTPEQLRTLAMEGAIEVAE